MQRSNIYDSLKNTFRAHKLTSEAIADIVNVSQKMFEDTWDEGYEYGYEHGYHNCSVDILMAGDDEEEEEASDNGYEDGFEQGYEDGYNNACADILTDEDCDEDCDEGMIEVDRAESLITINNYFVKGTV